MNDIMHLPLKICFFGDSTRGPRGLKVGDYHPWKFVNRRAHGHRRAHGFRRIDHSSDITKNHIQVTILAVLKMHPTPKIVVDYRMNCTLLLTLMYDFGGMHFCATCHALLMVSGVAYISTYKRRQTGL
jgi:hypothetical protein